jgi:hypothetical protein
MSMATLAELGLLIYKLAFMLGISLSLIYFTRSAWKTLKQDWLYLKRLHQIPCDRCVFYTGEYNLKCTVHPHKAFQEEAIGCLDYQAVK